MLHTTKLALTFYPLNLFQAGLFAWLNFSMFLSESTKEAELELFQKLFNDHKVYVVPGSEFSCEQFGWFRVVISVEPQNLDAGIRRIKSALLEISNHKGLVSTNHKYSQDMEVSTNLWVPWKHGKTRN